MKMRKLFAVLCASVMVALMLTACTGTSTKSDVVKLTMSLWDEVQLPVIQENVDKFNAAHEGEIEVVIEQIPWDTYWTKLDASLETSEAPDVFWMNVYLPKYVEAGVVEPLDAYIDGESFDLSGYSQGRINAFVYEGAHYALPKGLDTVAVALNTALFEKYGVALPEEGWTWDDMRAIADELKAAIAAGGGAEYPIVMELDSQPSWMNFLYQNGGSYISADGRTVGTNSAESKDAIQQVVDLMANGQMAPYAVLSETKGTDLFVSGQAGIVFIGSWKASVLEECTLAQDGSITLIQMPAMAKSNASVMGGLGYVMSSQCKNKEAAWELIKFITSEEALAYEAEKSIDIPAYLSAQSSYVANFKNINAQVFMDASKTGFGYPSNGNFDWTSYVDDAMQEAFAGSKPVSEALDEGAAKAQKVLDELFA